MALSYKARKRWALAVLVLGLPAYVFVAVTVIGLFDRPALWLELLIYVVLGFAWIMPLRRLFLGLGRGAPGGDRSDGDTRG